MTLENKSFVAFWIEPEEDWLWQHRVEVVWKRILNGGSLTTAENDGFTLSQFLVEM